MYYIMHGAVFGLASCTIRDIFTHFLPIFSRRFGFLVGGGGGCFLVRILARVSLYFVMRIVNIFNGHIAL